MAADQAAALFEDSVGLTSLGVFADSSGSGLRCVAGDLGDFQGFGVGHPEMAGDVDDPDGVVGGNFIEVRSGGVARFVQERVVIAAAGDPFAFGGLIGLL